MFRSKLKGISYGALLKSPSDAALLSTIIEFG